MIQSATISNNLIQSRRICHNLIHTTTIWNAPDTNLVDFGTIWYNLGKSGRRCNLGKSSTIWYIWVLSDTIWYNLVHPSPVWYSLVQSIQDTLDTNLVQFRIIWYNLSHFGRQSESGTIWSNLHSLMLSRGSRRLRRWPRSLQAHARHTEAHAQHTQAHARHTQTHVGDQHVDFSLVFR